MRNLELLHAYRRLYRASLEAVHYSTPARYQIRDIIRSAFRNDLPSNFIPRRIHNTERFLRRAKEHNGIEHKILRNILFTSYWNRHLTRKDKVPGWMRANDEVGVRLRRARGSHFDATLVMLNESMDLCLRSSSVVG